MKGCGVGVGSTGHIARPFVAERKNLNGGPGPLSKKGRRFRGKFNMCGFEHC